MMLSVSSFSKQSQWWSQKLARLVIQTLLNFQINSYDKKKKEFYWYTTFKILSRFLQILILSTGVGVIAGIYEKNLRKLN